MKFVPNNISSEKFWFFFLLPHSHTHTHTFRINTKYTQSTFSWVNSNKIDHKLWTAYAKDKQFMAAMNLISINADGLYL